MEGLPLPVSFTPNRQPPRSTLLFEFDIVFSPTILSNCRSFHGFCALPGIVMTIPGDLRCWVLRCYFEASKCSFLRTCCDRPRRASGRVSCHLAIEQRRYSG